MHEGDRPGQYGVSRRRFLHGAGGAVAGGALGVIPSVARGEEPDAPAARPGVRRYPATGQRVTLQVNGRPQQIFITPQTTLLEALREQMDLTGSKQGCDRGACGACTMLLDGRAVNSCMTLALDAVGRPITTVEGLAANGQLDPVQQAFVEHDACQCGYCIPGFVVSARAMLNEMSETNLSGVGSASADPTALREQIKQGLCGNICRCAAYVRIFDAVEAAAKEERA